MTRKQITRRHPSESRRLIAAPAHPLHTLLLSARTSELARRVKRRYGVKDASGLIPGHGGILDRLDGMLLTAPTLAVVLFVVDRGWI